MADYDDGGGGLKRMKMKEGDVGGQRRRMGD